MNSISTPETAQPKGSIRSTRSTDHKLSIRSAAQSTTSISRIPSAVINYEKVGLPGYQEQLGSFHLCSLLPLGLIINIALIAVSAAILWKTEIADNVWVRVITEDMPFPAISGTHLRSHPYFEHKSITATPLGRLLKSRYHWSHSGLYFGLSRETDVHFYGVICLFVLLGMCTFHLLLVCILKRCRRQFQIISLGYGLVGLILFAILLSLLYKSLVHKVSSYIENAFHPPTLNETEEAQKQFVHLTLICAFSFATPNHFVKYPIGHIRTDEFVIEGSKYSNEELMELGVCPRQDYLMIVLCLLLAATIVSWVISAYSEILEYEILGPPIWMQRFKTKIHRGLRHWQTRSHTPSTLDVNRDTNVNALDSNADDHTHHHHHHPHRHKSDGQSKIYRLVDSAVNHPDKPMWDDVYNVLDGGTDHIVLVPQDHHHHHASGSRSSGS